MSALAKLFPNATERPWHWEAIDASGLALYGPKNEYDHVLWARICPACQTRKGARCTAPSDADMALIKHAVNTYDARDALLMEAREMLQDEACVSESDKCQGPCNGHELAAKIESLLEAHP